MQRSEVYEAAIAYARAGVPVLPIARGSKSPHGVLGKTGGFHHATTDFATIAGWFDLHPDITAIGARPGVGYVVIDIDSKDDGFAVLRDHESRLGALPDTRTTLTPTGGEHRWFSVPSGVDVQTQLSVFGKKGVDVISRTGYVLMPPSLHPNGKRYEHDASDTAIAPLPQQWIDALLAAETKPAEAIGERIASGGRNGTLTSLAGTMRRRGMSEVAIRAALRATNREQCDPPLDEREVDTIAKSVARYAPGGTAAYAEAPSVLAVDGADSSIVGKAAGDDRLESATVIDAVDLLSRPHVDPAFLVRYLVPEKAIVLLSGDSGSCKTALALHIAAAIAAGAPVAGRFHVADVARPVLYVNGEMPPDLLVRYLREAVAGVGVAPGEGQIVFEGIDGFSNWKLSAATKARFEDLVERIRPCLVIIDTQRRVLIRDETDQIEVGEAFEWLRRQIVNQYGATALICHHLRKLSATSNNPRERVSGSSDIIGSSDVHIAALSKRSGDTMHAIYLNKDRFPADGVGQGTEWPIEARLEFGAPGEGNRSVFIAGEIGDASEAAVQTDDTTRKLLAKFEIGGPLTRIDCTATAGNAKRCFDSLVKQRTIVSVGKRGRQKLFVLAELATGELVQLDPSRDPVRRKATSDKDLNRVNGRPGSNLEGRPEASVDASRQSAATVEPREPGQVKTPIGEPVQIDPIREPPDQRTGSNRFEPVQDPIREVCAFPIGLPGENCKRSGCGLPWDAHQLLGFGSGS